MLVSAIAVARAIEAIAQSLRTSRAQERLTDSRTDLHPQADNSAQFRVQFVGASDDRDSLILKEVGIEAADVPTAIVAAAKIVFPPKTIGLRILDPSGRHVFMRHKAAYR
jgi:hypothetical protein